MNIDDVINVIEHEKECVNRNIRGCNRDCAKCDLVLPDTDIIQAYNFVLSTLRGLKYDARRN